MYYIEVGCLISKYLGIFQPFFYHWFLVYAQRCGDIYIWPYFMACSLGASLVAQRIKCLPAMQETWVWSLGWEDPLEKEMATHSSILAWRIPWTEEPGGLQSMGSQRVGHNSATSLSLSFTFMACETFVPLTRDWAQAWWVKAPSPNTTGPPGDPFLWFLFFQMC